MRFVSSSAAIVAALMATGSTSAAVVVTSSPGAPDPGPAATETQVITFDASLPTGVSLSGDGAIVTGSSPNNYAAPAGDLTPYLAAPFAASSGAAEVDFAAFLGNQNVTQFSFYWGSIDQFNTVDLLDRNGASFFSLNGSAISPANGDQTAPSTNRRVTFTLTGPSMGLGALRFTSTNKAFEVDTLSFATALKGGIPEPASWAMMVVGFIGAGAMIRRRNAPNPV